MISHHTRLVYALILSALVASVAIFFLQRWLWSEEYSAGVIVSIENGDFILKDAQGREISVDVTRETKVFRGRDPLYSTLEPGMSVVVVGDMTETGMFAEVVRVVNPDDMPKRFPQR